MNALQKPTEKTELVLAQEEAQFYKFALDQAALVTITDASGIITHANENFCQISGYKEEELVGQNHRMLNSGMMGDGFFSAMWKTISSGKIWKGEICNRAKDGHFYWVDTAIVPFLGSRGRPEKYIAIRSDISQRKKAEESLIQTKEFTQKAFQRLEEAESIGKFGSWEWNIVDHTFQCSKGFSQILHWPENITPSYELFMSTLLVEDRSLVEPAMEAALAAQQPFSCDYRIKLPDNSIRWIRSIGRPVLDQNQSVKLMGTSQDVTEKIQTEQDLMDATIKADSAMKTKAEFLANMSHEIRTPMNGVIGMCNLLLESVSNPAHLDQLRIIQNCGNSLLNIINDILDFSKLEAGKVVLENEPFDIYHTSQEVLQLLNVRASEKRITLNYLPSPSSFHWVLGDTTRFRQILTNLVSNAIKFTEKGGVTVFSQAEKRADGKIVFQYAVRDSGIGIQKEAINKLFTSFSQADLSTTRKYGGSGLGLAICKGLCEKMGGKIWLESELGAGSTFFFQIVLEESCKQNIPSLGGAISELNIELSKKYPLNILIAEDNRVNQLVAVGFLEKMGYHPDVAANGFEVLENLKRKKYDLIFMDYHMPEMDGIDATKKIHAEYKDCPYIVALTASAMKQDIDRCYEAGMNDFISKPIQVSELVRIITSLAVVTATSDDAA